jgi:hypothetical protein
MALFSRLSENSECIGTPADRDEPAVNHALMRLKRAEREVILLHYDQELSVAEICGRLGIKEGACRMRLRRGVESLRRRLGVSGFAAFARSFGPHRSLAGSASTAPSMTATNLAASLAKTLSLQTAARVVALGVCVVAVGGVGAAAFSKGLVRHASPVPTDPAIPKAQDIPPLPNDYRLEPVGPLPPGSKFEISFFKDGNLIDRQEIEAGGNEYVLAKCDLAGWPFARRAPIKGSPDSVTRTDIDRLHAEASDVALKFKAGYLPPKDGKQRLLINGSVLASYEQTFKMQIQELPESEGTMYNIMVLRPDQNAGFIYTEMGRQMELEQGKWEQISGDKEDKLLGAQMLHMGQSLQEDAPGGNYLGITIQKVSRAIAP